MRFLPRPVRTSLIKRLAGWASALSKHKLARNAIRIQNPQVLAGLTLLLGLAACPVTSTAITLLNAPT